MAEGNNNLVQSVADLRSIIRIIKIIMLIHCKWRDLYRVYQKCVNEMRLESPITGGNRSKHLGKNK